MDRFQKRVEPAPLRIGDLVLKVIRGLIRDPRGKFRPNWSGPYFIRELTPEAYQRGSTKEVLCLRPWSDPSQVRCSFRIIITHITISSSCFICLLIDIIFTLGILRTDSVVFGLRDREFMDPHGSARSLSLTGCSLRRGHGRYLTEPLRSIQLVPHFSTLGCHHASPSGRSSWIYVHDSVMDSDDQYYMLTLSGVNVIFGWSRLRLMDSRVVIPRYMSDLPMEAIALSHIILISITRPRYIVFASLTIIPELFINTSSQRSVVRDS
ncbi:hypothetical protein AAG906_038948 [Vitis piasezkii]